MLKIEQVIKSGNNFTAAGIIYRYGKNHGIKTENKYGSTYIIINGNYYGYDHYQVIDNANGTETVIVYLALKSKG